MDVSFKNLDTVSQYQLEQAFVNHAIGLISQDSKDKLGAHPRSLHVHLYSIEDTRGNPAIVDKLKRGIRENYLVIIEGDIIRLPGNFFPGLKHGERLLVKIHQRSPHHPYVEKNLEIDNSLTVDELMALFHTLEEVSPTYEKNRETKQDSLTLVEHNHQLVPKRMREKRKKEAIRKLKHLSSLSNEESIEKLKDRYTQEEKDRLYFENAKLAAVLDKESQIRDSAWIDYHQKKQLRG